MINHRIIKPIPRVERKFTRKEIEYFASLLQYTFKLAVEKNKVKVSNEMQDWLEFGFQLIPHEAQKVFKTQAKMLLETELVKVKQPEENPIVYDMGKADDE